MSNRSYAIMFVYMCLSMRIFSSFLDFDSSDSSLKVCWYT